MSIVGDFAADLVDYGTTLMQNAARLAHVEDGSAVLVPTGWQLSRYTVSPSGNAFTATASTLLPVKGNGLGGQSQINAAITALQAADLVAVQAVTAAGNSLLASLTPDAFGPALSSYVKAFQTAAPRDAITLLQSIAYRYIASANAPQIVLLYVFVLRSLAQSILDYETQTSNEATDILNQYVALFDITTPAASDLGWADTVLALQSLRASVLQFLQQQVASEPTTMQHSFNQSLPDVCVAYALYGDARMAPAIVRANNPVNPLFMSTTVSYINTAVSQG